MLRPEAGSQGRLNERLTAAGELRRLQHHPVQGISPAKGESKWSGDRCPRDPQDFRGFSSPHWGVRAKELCHLRRVACAIKASCLITREGFHHPTIGHQVGHKAWQRLRRQLGFICVRINPIQDHHLHIPQLGIKHMHGAVHISPEGATWILVVCLLHPTIGYQRGGTRPSLRVVASQRFLPEGNTWNGDGRLQRSHLGEMWYYQHPCPAVQDDNRTTTLLLPITYNRLEWEGPGGLVTPVWVDDCVASSTTSVSYSSKPAAQLNI